MRVRFLQQMKKETRMKQRAKRSKEEKPGKPIESNSAKIRRMARAVLEQAGGGMKLYALRESLEKLLGMSIRTDHFPRVLATEGSGIKIFPVAVLRKKNHCREDAANSTRKENPVSKSSKKSASKHLSPEEFTLRAIERLKKPGFKGIHTVYSGFNGAFREYFPGLDPVKEIQKLADEGKVASQLRRGGAVIYKPADKPLVRDSADEIIRKIVG